MARPIDPLNRSRLEALAEMQENWTRKKQEKEANSQKYKDEKGRFISGPNNPNYKLTRNQACKILIRLTNFKQSYRTAGAAYGVSHVTVQKVAKGKHRHSGYSPGADKLMELFLEVSGEIKQEKSNIL